jgi:YVTN family beta-propeller protein
LKNEKKIFAKSFLFFSVFVLFTSNALLSADVYAKSVPPGTVELATANYSTMYATIIANDKRVATVSVGFNPVGQVGWDGNDFWIANLGSASVSLISASTNKVVRAIGDFEDPDGALFDPANGMMYVADYGANAVYPVNDTTLAVGNGIPVGSDPEFMAYSPATNEIYVGNIAGSSVSVINTSSNAVITTISVGSSGDAIRGLAYAPNTKDVYVLDESDSGVYQINSHNKIAKFGIFSGFLWNVAYNPINGMIYVTTSTNQANENGAILVINPKTLTLDATISCGKPLCHTQSAPTGITFDSQNGLIYAADENNNVLIPINGTTIAGPVIPAGFDPQGVTAGNPIA